MDLFLFSNTLLAVKQYMYKILNKFFDYIFSSKNRLSVIVWSLFYPFPTNWYECLINPFLCFAGFRHVLHRCPSLWQCESLYQPPVRAQPRPRQSVHRTPGSALSTNLLLRFAGYPSQRGTRVRSFIYRMSLCREYPLYTLHSIY